MAKSVVELGVKDNGFNAKLKSAMNLFAQLGSAASNAKGQFSKMADGLSQVAQSQQMVNAALKGNPYGLLAQAATAAFTKIIEKATEATDAEKRALEWSEKRSEREQSVNEAIGRSTGELIAKYELLRTSWAALSTDQEKTDWIKNNQSAFKGLNLAVNDVTSAENVFVNNTSQVVAALKARAEAEAYGELYKEEIKKNALKKATGAYNPQRITADYRPSITEAELAGLTNEDYEHKTSKIWSIQKGRYVDYRERTGRLNSSGIAKMQALRNMGAASLENADRMGAEYYGNMMTQAQANALALGKGLLGPTGSGGGGGRGGHKSIVEEKDEFKEVIGLINNAKEAVSDLQRQRNEANTVEDIDAIDKKLAVAVKYYDELVNRGKDVKQTFATGLSGFNTNTMNAWMQGRQGDLSKAEFGSADYKSIAGNIADMNAIKSILEQSMNAGIDSAQFNLSALWEKVFDGENIPDSTWQSMIDTINVKLKKAGIDPISINFETGGISGKSKSSKETKKISDGMNKVVGESSKMVGGISNIVNGISSMGVEIPRDIQGVLGGIQGVISILSGIAAIVSVIEALTSAQTAISAVKATPVIGWALAGGGIVHAASGYSVPGNHYSGDMVPAMLNSGELVLNKAQQGNLASQLQNNNAGGYTPSHVSGEQIWIALNAYTKRTGKGELITWR